MKYNIIPAILAVFILTSCGTYMKSTPLDSKTNYFPARKNRIATVLINIAVNADTLKKLLVVQSNNYWSDMGKNMNYFNEVITLSEFENQIIKSKVQDKVISLSDKFGLNRAYRFYRPFVMLEFTKVSREDGYYAGLLLFDPNKAEIIFKNEIKIDQIINPWSDQTTLYPLFNSLLEYLRLQK